MNRLQSTIVTVSLHFGPARGIGPTLVLPVQFVFEDMPWMAKCWQTWRHCGNAGDTAEKVALVHKEDPRPSHTRMSLFQKRRPQGRADHFRACEGSTPLSQAGVAVLNTSFGDTEYWNTSSATFVVCNIHFLRVFLPEGHIPA